MADIKDIRHFSGAAGMNLDDDEKILQPNEYREIHNARLIGSESDNAGSAENELGNTAITNYNHPTYTLPAGDNKVIGSCIDVENNAIYYFVKNAFYTNHCILRYNITENTIDHIVYAEPGLAFGAGMRITHANVLGGMLFWVDGSYPKMLDIEKAYNYTNGSGTSFFDSYSIITDQILNVIKYPPLESPTGEYVNDYAYDQNNLQGKLFQFKTRYTYDNNEVSVASPISDLIKPMAETFINGNYYEDEHINNRIDVTFNSGSKEVIKIDIIAREGNNGHWRLVKTFHKYIDSGVAYGVDDNGSPFWANSDKVYYFYNNVIGTVLDQDDIARDQDYVPLESSCQEIIEKNRLIYADNTEGFTNVDIDVTLTPVTKSVEFESDNNLEYSIYSSFVPFPGATTHYMLFYIPNTAITPVEVGNAYELSLRFKNQTTGSIYVKTFLQQALEGENNADIADKFITAINTYSDFTFGHFTGDNKLASLDANTLGSTTLGAFWIYAEKTVNGNQNLWVSYPYHADNYLKLKASSVAYETHKSGAWHEYGLRYYDYAGRGGNVNTSNECNKYIPFYTQDNGYTGLTQVNRIQWQINHNPPSWASSYQWCYTKNTSMLWSKMFLLGNNQFDDASGAFWKVEINKRLNDTIDEYPLVKREVYNDWQQGDKIRFIAQYNQTSYKWATYPALIEYEIFNAEIDDVADPNVYYIKIPLFDIGLIADDPSFSVLAEIYRPRKELPDDENDRIFYEIGPRYTITNGLHDTPSGNIANGHDLKGDAYFRTFISAIGTPIFDTFSFSDYYLSEYTSIGRPAIVDKNAKRVQYKADLRYGGVYVQNSQINDLCKFEAANFEELSEKWGAITKIKEIGYSLKVLQEYKSNSIFIGREGLRQATYEGANIVVGVSAVLANISPSEDRWGCQNPESVFIDGRRMYYVDKHNRAVIRNARNGNFPISEYKTKDYIRDLLDGIGNDSRIFGYFDGKYEEVGFTFSTRIRTHVSSMVFKEGDEQRGNRWTTFMDYYGSNGNAPDNFAFTGETLVSWMDGILYLHYDNSTRGEFYGEKHNLSVEVISNKEPLSTKVFDSMGYISNVKWENDGDDVCEITIKPSSNYPVGMTSVLKSEQFQPYEDEYWSAFMKDLYTNSDITTPTETYSDLFNGRELRGKSIKIKMISDSDDEVVLFSVIIKSTASR